MGKTTQKNPHKHLLPAAPGRSPSKNPIALPLFEAPSVTTDDIALWIATIAPHIAPRYHARYATDYDVASKIERAKAGFPYLSC